MDVTFFGFHVLSHNPSWIHKPSSHWIGSSPAPLSPAFSSLSVWTSSRKFRNCALVPWICHTAEHRQLPGFKWRFPARHGGYPKSWMVYSGKPHLEIDDDWGYPYLRKPPNGTLVKYNGCRQKISSMSLFPKPASKRNLG